MRCRDWGGQKFRLSFTRAIPTAKSFERELAAAYPAEPLAFVFRDWTFASPVRSDRGKGRLDPAAAQEPDPALSSSTRPAPI